MGKILGGGPVPERDSPWHPCVVKSQVQSCIVAVGPVHGGVPEGFLLPPVLMCLLLMLCALFSWEHWAQPPARAARVSEGHHHPNDIVLYPTGGFPWQMEGCGAKCLEEGGSEPLCSRWVCS